MNDPSTDSVKYAHLEDIRTSLSSKSSGAFKFEAEEIRWTELLFKLIWTSFEPFGNVWLD